MNMHIHTNTLIATPSSAHSEVCHLRSYTGKGDQSFDAIWDIRVPLVAEELGGLLNVLCFEVVEADFVDEGIESGGFKSENRLKIEALQILVAIT
jgi:hypothetical protein